jgi:sorbitol-6-phosphate 2-dehydrogenase
MRANRRGRYMSTLEGKKAIVTGGAQGLGEAICIRLAQEGCDIVIGDINEELAAKTASTISEQTGRKVIAAKVDVSNEADVENMFKTAVSELGRVDVVVANAAILIAKPIREFELKEWQAVINVNLTGYFLTTKHAARIMVEQGSGSIIEINSKSGKKGSSKNSAYAASKFGGIGHTQSVALELAEYGIRVNAICPGNLLDSPLWVNSLYKQYADNLGITEEEVRQKYVDQVPMKRGCTYDDVTNLLVFLASDKSSYITGQALNVTGGQQM